VRAGGLLNYVLADREEFLSNEIAGHFVCRPVHTVSLCDCGNRTPVATIFVGLVGYHLDQAIFADLDTIELDTGSTCSLEDA
jgi:hypothetical protein